MQKSDLFRAALGLMAPWFVRETKFDAEARRLDIYIDFPRGSVFACPSCGTQACKVYDTEAASWRHLNFFQHEAHLHGRVPRIQCRRCGVKRIALPWARAGSGFTLLFEALIMTMVPAMPVKAVARLVGEHDTRLWRMIHHYVDQARGREDHSGVCQIAMDETAARRGHDYVSLFVDLDWHKVLFATPGKDAQTVAAFAQDLEAHGGRAEQILEVCQDMSPAFLAGVKAELPKASITFDKFHVVKLLNDAVDKVRRAEQKDRPELRKSRYLWLKNPGNLTVAQQQKLAGLKMPKCNLKTARAYQIRLTFQDCYNQPADQAEAFLKRWYFWATHSRLEPIIAAAKTIKRHWDGVLRWHQSKLANGVLEGINSLVQAAKAKARGYRSTRNLTAMIYLIAGKLDLRLPT